MKSKYETNVAPNLDKIAEYVSQGYSDEKIAEKLGVAYSTFREYVKRHSALSAALKKCKRARDETVEDSLYKKATGFYVPVTRQFKLRRIEYDEHTGKKIKEYEELVEVEEQEYVPADTGAMIFYLINRMGDKYSNNPQRIRLDKAKFKYTKERAEKEDV